MSFDQVAALSVLVAVIAALVWGRVRSDVIALTGAAVLLATGTIRPVEVQSAFASPALIALASLFVIAYAMELSGLLDFFIRRGIALCRRLGSLGLWLMIFFCGAASAFLNNTPIVVLSAPVVRDVAVSLKLSPRRFLIPLSYAAVLGGCCTLIGTSTNLLVNDMARAAGQPSFSVFEISGVGVTVALIGGAFLFIVGGRLLDGRKPPSGPAPEVDAEMLEAADTGTVGHAEVFSQHRPMKPLKALMSLAVFIGVVTVATFGWAPIAASAFAGAVLLILARVISAEEAYAGLRPEILLLIAGMVVIGLSLEVTGLAAAATDGLVSWVRPLGPLGALVILYGVTLFLTEALSNATVAVLVTPVAVALGDSLGVDPRPFLVAVMIAASAAFATPFGYQTNVLVYQLGGYAYTDFLKIGLPLNLITWAAAVAAIPVFFPF
jgi:di/tricarboxylate transporter